LKLRPCYAEQQKVLERHKIDFLINSVAALKGAGFIRNGSTYDAAQAASHLRMKLRFAGSRVKTAQDFIVYCASKSSMSGIAYRIHFTNGRDVDSEVFLRQRLAEYAAAHAPHTDPGH
jgi:hypothetical protein